MPPKGPKDERAGVADREHWYRFEGAKPPEALSPGFLCAVVELLKEELKTRRLAERGGGGQPRLENIQIGNAGGGMYLELEVDNLWNARMETLRICKRVDDENVFVAAVRLKPAEIMPEAWSGQKTETGVISMKTHIERTPAGGKAIYRSADLHELQLAQEAVLDFLRASGGQFRTPVFDVKLAELVQIGEAAGKSESDVLLGRAGELVEGQRRAIKEAAGILKRATKNNLALTKRVADLEFSRNIMYIIIAALSALIALGVIMPQSCQRIHDVLSGKDNGAQGDNDGRRDDARGNNRSRGRSEQGR